MSVINGEKFLFGMQNTSKLLAREVEIEGVFYLIEER